MFIEKLGTGPSLVTRITNNNIIIVQYALPIVVHIEFV